jgi:hypothetical protein
VRGGAVSGGSWAISCHLMQNTRRLSKEKREMEYSKVELNSNLKINSIFLDSEH